MNSITIAGLVGADPTPSATRGGARATAIDPATGEPIVRTTLEVVVKHRDAFDRIAVHCRGGLAERVIARVRKGDRVLVVARLVADRWETPAGEARSTLQVVASDVGMSLYPRHEPRTKAAS